MFQINEPKGLFSNQIYDLTVRIVRLSLMYLCSAFIIVVNSSTVA